VRLPPGLREDEVVAGAAARGLAVEGLGAFAAAESREDPALIVGYGAPAEHAFTAAVARLTAALAE
jgi:GntR family transcriptional regulator / MocR family aminotransferase